jgi:hypothetical protein
MKTLLFILSLTPFFLNAQKILFEKADPFTGKKTLITDNMPLMKAGGKAVLQVGAALDIKQDTLNQFRISFVMFNPGAIIQTKDTTTAFNCLIKTSDDSVITGNYLGMATVPIGQQLYSGFTYTLTMNQMLSLIGAICTDVKFTAPNNNQFLFAIDKNSQDNISKVISVLVDKWKTPNKK